MPRQKASPEHVIGEIRKIVEQFNEKDLKGFDCEYAPRIKGSYLYLDLDRDDAEPHLPVEICRRYEKLGV